MTENIYEIDIRKINTFEIGKYGVVLADPPWRYDFSVDSSDAIESHYSTLALSEIVAIPVSDLTLPDSVLILWGTWPKLPEALSVMKSWGFEYVTGFPWIKMKADFSIHYGMGYWVRGCSECLLIGRKGKVSPPKQHGFLGLLAPNLQHSRKPDSIYELAETLPGPYIELFARRPRSDWTVVGNEIETDVPLFERGWM